MEDAGPSPPKDCAPPLASHESALQRAERERDEARRDNEQLRAELGGMRSLSVRLSDEIERLRAHNDELRATVSNANAAHKSLSRKHATAKTELGFLLWTHIPNNVERFRPLSQRGPCEYAKIETEHRLDEIEIRKSIGRGRFRNEVRLGVLERQAGQGELVVVKSIAKAGTLSLKHVEQIRNEMVAMSAIAKAASASTEHLVRLVSARFSETHIHLVQQWGGADLASLMLAYERAAAITGTNPAVDAAMPSPLAAFVMAGLAAALDACRTLGWVHGDIKPENLLLGNDVKTIMGSGTKAIHVRLCDFSRSRRLDEHVTHIAPYCALGFTAPEVYLAEHLRDAVVSSEQEQEDGDFSLARMMSSAETTTTTAAADVWSAGATLLEMLIGHDRFESIWISAYRQTRGTSETYEWLVRLLQRARLTIEQLVLFPAAGAPAGTAAATGRTLMVVSPLVISLTSMMKQCLNVDPTKRISCSELLQCANRTSSALSEADDGLPNPKPARVFLRRHHYEAESDRTASTITPLSPKPEMDPFGRPEVSRDDARRYSTRHMPPEPGVDAFGRPGLARDDGGHRNSAPSMPMAAQPDDSATTEQSPASVFDILPDDVQPKPSTSSRPLTAPAAVLGGALARIAAQSVSKGHARSDT